MTTLIIDYSQGHHVRHWEEHRHTWLFSDIMVPTIQHGQLVVCSDSYHFGRANHICGWLVFNWSSDSKQALWSVSMPMVIMIQFWYFLLRYIWRRMNRIWALDFIALSKKGLIIWQRGYKQAPIISAKSSNSESTFFGTPCTAEHWRTKTWKSTWGARTAQIYLGLTAHSGQLCTLFLQATITFTKSTHVR